MRLTVGEVEIRGDLEKNVSDSTTSSVVSKQPDGDF